MYEIESKSEDDEDVRVLPDVNEMSTMRRIIAVWILAEYDEHAFIADVRDAYYRSGRDSRVAEDVVRLFQDRDDALTNVIERALRGYSISLEDGTSVGFLLHDIIGAMVYHALLAGVLEIEQEVSQEQPVAASVFFREVASLLVVSLFPSVLVSFTL